MDFVDAGCVHPSVHYARSAVYLQPGARICIKKESIFCGRLAFLRPAEFSMGTRSYVGNDSDIRVTSSIVIGDDVLVSWGCTLMDTDMHSIRFSERQNDVIIEGSRRGLTHADKNWSVVRCEPIVIQDKAWIGMKSMILRGVTLGEGCVVGAGSVVRQSVPPWTIVAGNPARVIRELSEQERDLLGTNRQACDCASVWSAAASVND